MAEIIQIKGIVKSEHPVLYAAIEKNMIAYSIKKVRVKILQHGMNAAAISFLGDYLIVTNKLIEIMNDDEIEAIIAHEFSHIYNRDHIVKLTILFLFALPFLYIYSRIHLGSVSLGLGIALLIAFFIFMYGLKVMNWISVLQEVRSDREAILKTSKPEAMITALLRLYSAPFTIKERPNYFEKILESFGYLFWYFYGFTHPGSKERIEYLEFAKKMLVLQKGSFNQEQNENEVVEIKTEALKEEEKINYSPRTEEPKIEKALNQINPSPLVPINKKLIDDDKSKKKIDLGVYISGALFLISIILLILYFIF
jgi:heat shock protein HtpX